MVKAYSQWQHLSPRLLGQALRDEKQRAVSCNALVNSAIGTGSQWLETASSQWQCLSPLSYWDRSSVMRNSNDSALVNSAIGTGPQRAVRDSEQSVAIP